MARMDVRHRIWQFRTDIEQFLYMDQQEMLRTVQAVQEAAREAAQFHALSRLMDLEARLRGLFPLNPMPEAMRPDEPLPPSATRPAVRGDDAFMPVFVPK